MWLVGRVCVVGKLRCAMCHEDSADRRGGLRVSVQLSSQHAAPHTKHILTLTQHTYTPSDPSPPR